MPIVNGRNVSPDEAMLLGLCPECGKAVTPRTALAHANDHWGGGTRSPEAQRRYDMLVNFANSKVNPPAAPAAPAAPETSVPDHDTRPFWIDQIIAGIIAAAGLTLLFSEQHVFGVPSWICGLGLSVVGFGWLIYLRSEWRASAMNVQGKPNVWALAIVVVAIVLMGYDIYDRHQHDGQVIGHMKDFDTGAVIVGRSSQPSPPLSASPPPPEFTKYSNMGDGWPHLPLDKGQDWDFAQWMKKAAASDAPPRLCSVLFVRYQSPPAEDLVAALDGVLDLADWKHKESLTLDVLPKGVTVLIPPESDNHVINCAINFSNGVRQFAGIVPSNYPYKTAATSELTKCGADCVEVEIGNFPEK